MTYKHLRVVNKDYQLKIYHINTIKIKILTFRAKASTFGKFDFEGFGKNLSTMTTIQTWLNTHKLTKTHYFDRKIAKNRLKLWKIKFEKFYLGEDEGIRRH